MQTELDDVVKLARSAAKDAIEGKYIHTHRSALECVRILMDVAEQASDAIREQQGVSAAEPCLPGGGDE